MLRMKPPSQLDIFDPWDFLTTKRRQMLETGWPGLFRKHILPSIPVQKIIPHFDINQGRPTKELYALIGALIIQQTNDLTDEETIQQFSFNIQWHYALNITEESDAAKYMSLKTLWNIRNIVASNEIDKDIFAACTANLAKVFKVNIEKQRIDSVHIKSNMRRLSRIGIFSESICKFLKNLKRQHRDAFIRLDKTLTEKYLSNDTGGCFAHVKPSESKKTLKEVARDLFDLVQEFRSDAVISKMYSYKLLHRVLEEHCNLTDHSDNPVELKPAKDVASDSLQNPSDPDATYSGHKGQGYQVQIQETYVEQEDNDEDAKPLNLITHVEVEPAHHSDANALIPAIKATEEQDMKPDKLLADSLYGSDENREEARKHGVELIAPVMGTVNQDKLTLADFELSDEGIVTACPAGKRPAKITIKRRINASFEISQCGKCPNLQRCPVKAGKKFYYLRYSRKQMRLAKLRQYEGTEDFKDKYRWRAGVEATMSEYDRRTGVKHLRVRGMKAVRFCATLKALGLNILRATAAMTTRLFQECAICTA